MTTRCQIQRFATGFLIFLLLATTTGCQTTGSKRWWQFWKRTPPRMFPIDDTQLLPPQPDMAPIGMGSTEDFQPSGTLPAATPDRSAVLMTVPDLQTIYFAYDSDRLTSAMISLLQQNAQWIKANPSVTIQIEGHCDERGSTEYNFALGQRRADAVREWLVAQGIDPNRLITISYGKERPIDPRSNEEAWAKNRRAQFLAY